MALPGGFNEATLIQIYGGNPLDYQLAGYLGNVAGASGNQVTLVTTEAKKHQGVVDPDKLIVILKNNS